MKIRAATLSDVKDLAAMVGPFFSQGQLEGTGLVIDSESTEKYMESFINIPGSIFLVAEESEVVGSIAGMMVPWMFNHSQTVSHEMWWTVKEDYRGNAGAMLIRGFYKESKRRGATAVVGATSGNKEEPRVVAHYLKTGFRHLEHHFIKGVR